MYLKAATNSDITADFDFPVMSLHNGLGDR